MTGLPYLEHIRTQTDAFLNATQRNFTKRVPSCPDWDVRDLVEHVWEALYFWGEVAETKAQDRSELVEPEYPTDENLVEAVAQASDRLTRVLAECSPDEPVWTWSSNKTMSFIGRRMAHEMSVHRWDGEGAAGASISALDDSIAGDGIEEFIEHFFGADQVWEGPGLRVLLRSPSGDWLLEAGDPQDLPAAELRGSSADLFLATWRRVGLDALEIRGDAEASRRIFAWTDLS